VAYWPRILTNLRMTIGGGVRDELACDFGDYFSDS
jgi:hypothetical protein